MEESPKYAIDMTRSGILHSSNIQTRLRHMILWISNLHNSSLLHFMEIMTQRLPFIGLIPISSPHWQRAMKYLYIHRRLSFSAIKNNNNNENGCFASNAKISTMQEIQLWTDDTSLVSSRWRVWALEQPLVEKVGAIPKSTPLSCIIITSSRNNKLKISVLRYV